jgi:3-phenylpropionate/trans-cinnamate dioxygenase ferredoxin reductase component
MSTMVIIGGGQAAGQAIASLRQEGFEGKILMIGEEPVLPYGRPPLSKQYLAGTIPPEKLSVRPEKFYQDRNVELRLDETVTGIDPTQQTVSIQNETIGYDKLLIATGSTPRRLNIEGSDLAGIHYLRTQADVDAIRQDMNDAKKLCIVGGGYIGLEVASVAVTAGLSVDVLEMEERILQRVTTPFMSDFYHALHTGSGVNIHTSTGCAGFRGSGGRITHVLCGDKEIEADMVIVGIGIIPNTQLADEAGLDVDNGIVVDEQCRTSDPNIYAAGDCTNHPNPILGRRLRLESVPNAMDQARTAAANMLGIEKSYAAVPWFWSDQYDLKLQMLGFSGDADASVLRGDPSTRQFAQFYLSAGKVVAVDAVNSPKEFMVAKQLFGLAVDTDALSDPTVDLKSLVPERVA